MPKVFVPRNAGFTKKHIWEYFYIDNEGKRYLPVVVDDYNDEYIVPEFTANQIPDDICQSFVDKLYDLGRDYEYEEDRADAQRDLAAKFYPKILKAIKKG